MRKEGGEILQSQESQECASSKKFLLTLFLYLLPDCSRNLLPKHVFFLGYLCFRNTSSTRISNYLDMCVTRLQGQRTLSIVEESIGITSWMFGKLWLTLQRIMGGTWIENRSLSLERVSTQIAVWARPPCWKVVHALLASESRSARAERCAFIF